MDDDTRQRLQLEHDALRSEIKIWEKEWAHTHEGERPSRADIKQNADIARKYKQYGTLRDTLAGKIKPPSPQKRKSVSDAAISTPSKRSRHLETPSKRHASPDNNVTPTTISRTLFSPALPLSLGPTPQRDGKVLGLFGMLAAPGMPAQADTPSRRRGGPDETPSQKYNDYDDDSRIGRRTPMSAAKRNMLDTFMSPLKKGDANAAVGLRTPSRSGVSKLQFDTPAFLRRAPPPLKSGENDIAPLRLPKKPMGRALSTIVADLRQIEEEALDEELEALREMEAEEMGAMRTTKQGVTLEEPSNIQKGGESEVQRGEMSGTKDVQKGEMPKVQKGEKSTTKDALDDIPPELLAKDGNVGLLGGFDDEADFDEPEEEQLGRDGQPLRVYKKKGQKRTTRLHKMKPVRVKRPVEAEVAEEGDNDAEGSEFEDVEEKPKKKRGRLPKKAAAKTAAKGGKAKNKDAEESAEDGSQSDDNDEGVDEDEDEDEDDEKALPKRGRKINPNAVSHANFRRLKLRNSGAKGGAAFNSRFRRRR